MVMALPAGEMKGEGVIDRLADCLEQYRDLIRGTYPYLDEQTDAVLAEVEQIRKTPKTDARWTTGAGGNTIVTPSGEYYIGDLGIAKGLVDAHNASL
jgi:hypothetical protein